MAGDNQYQRVLEALRDKQSHVCSSDVLVNFVKARLASTSSVAAEYINLMTEHELILETEENKFLVLPTELDLKVNDMIMSYNINKYEEEWGSKRTEGLRKLIKTLIEVDAYNSSHEDMKLWNMEKAENEVMKYYKIEREKASKWINLAIAIKEKADKKIKI